MSHNSKYYQKKIGKRDAQGNMKINEMFSKQQNKPYTTCSSSEVEPMSHSDTISSTESDDQQGKEIPADRNNNFTILEETNNTTSTVSVGTLTTETNLTDNLFQLGLKYTIAHPWVYYNHSQKGFLCKVWEVFAPCCKSENEVPFVNLPVQRKSQGGHPNRKLEKHEKLNRHTTSMEKQTAYTSTLIKGNVLKQMQEAASNVKEQKIMANRKYIKNLLKTLYFMVRKKYR